VTPLKEARVGTARSGLLLLFGAVAALWLIAVANAMGLVFVHGRRRAPELAVRSAPRGCGSRPDSCVRRCA
jgi:hypothetical protein